MNIVLLVNTSQTWLSDNYVVIESLPLYPNKKSDTKSASWFLL